MTAYPNVLRTEFDLASHFQFLFQDHLYVQYVEITAFQSEFHQVSSKFKDNESLIQSISESGSTLGGVNTELDKLESLMEVIRGLNIATISRMGFIAERQIVLEIQLIQQINFLGNCC